MYLNFYQLNKKPFSLAPDPEFLYLSPQHKDALGAIIYGIREREGFVSVVGEVGTGKTTIIRSYLQKIDLRAILPIFIFNSRITFTELLETFLHEIGVSSEAIEKNHQVNDMVRLAYEVMLEKMSKGRNLVLIIDEAQNMPVETLGNLCILSNFETSKAKLIQIVLVGQPELQNKLDLYELRQLRQRIAYKALITPLSMPESFNYFHHRLTLSSRGHDPIFTKHAIKLIVKHSKGVPRIINVLSENSLVAGYGLQKKPLSAKLVKQVIADYEGSCFSTQHQRKGAAVSMLILIPSALLAASYLYSFPHAVSEAMEKLIGAKTIQESYGQSVRYDVRTISANKKLTAPVKDKVLITVNNPQLIATVDDSKISNLVRYDVRPISANKKLTAPVKDKAPITANKPQLIATVDDSKISNLPVETSSPLPTEPPVSTASPDVLEEQSTTDVAAEKSLWPKAESKFSLFAEGYKNSAQPSPIVKIIKKGDTVSKLCLDTYGIYNTRIHMWIKRHNPHIANMDEIQIGGVIFFPEMDPLLLWHRQQRVNGRLRATREEVVLK